MPSETVEEFVEKWEGIIDDIKNNPYGLDRGDAEDIELEFRLKSTMLLVTQFRNERARYYPKINLLESELKAALALATSKYKLKHRGILARIFGGAIDTLKTLRRST